MNSLFSRLIAVVASFFIFSAAWFCLWSISLHLVERPELAVLLFLACGWGYCCNARAATGRCCWAQSG